MLIVLRGLTGSGKTELLRALAGSGEQTIDLESLARHRGSAFGNLADAVQPSHAAFQAAVRDAMAGLDWQRRVWVEQKGEHIGSAGVPRELLAKMRNGRSIEVTDSIDNRMQRILTDYGDHPAQRWAEAVRRIRNRLGATRTKRALAALDRGDLEHALRMLLDYYDEGYCHFAERD